MSNNNTYTFWGYFTSTICYLLFLSINAWGKTDWFKILPLSVFYNFIYGIIIYSLSCVIYFFTNYILSSKYSSYRLKPVVFLLSFIPTLIFSLLVINLSRISVINSFVMISSISIWIIILVVSILHITINKLNLGEKLEINWLFCNLIFSIIHITFMLLSLLRVLPGIISPTLSMITFLFLSIYFFIKGFPWKENNNSKYIIQKYKISPREVEVLKLLVLGKKNEEIADELCISLSTVKTHIRNIFDKTKSRNRVEVRNLFNENTNTKVLA